MKGISRTVERKTGRAWSATYTTTDATTIYKDLAHDLQAKYIHRASYVKRITDRCNYDGTRTITVTYDNDTRSIYIVE